MAFPKQLNQQNRRADCAHGKCNSGWPVVNKANSDTWIFSNPRISRDQLLVKYLRETSIYFFLVSNLVTKPVQILNEIFLSKVKYKSQNNTSQIWLVEIHNHFKMVLSIQNNYLVYSYEPSFVTLADFFKRMYSIQRTKKLLIASLFFILK